MDNEVCRAPHLPAKGAVLGVDVGYSPTRRSSAGYRLDWTRETLAWDIARFRAVEPERTQAPADWSMRRHRDVAHFDRGRSIDATMMVLRFHRRTPAK